MEREKSVFPQGNNMGSEDLEMSPTPNPPPAPPTLRRSSNQAILIALLIVVLVVAEECWQSLLASEQFPAILQSTSRKPHPAAKKSLSIRPWATSGFIKARQ